MPRTAAEPATTARSAFRSAIQRSKSSCFSAAMFSNWLPTMLVMTSSAVRSENQLTIPSGTMETPRITSATRNRKWFRKLAFTES